MKKFLIAVFSLVILLYVFQSCQKIDATSLGAELIPPVDNINTFDTTLEVITDVRFLSDSTSIPYATSTTIFNFPPALGVMEDPEFGRTSANMYFELLPPVEGVYPFINKDSIQGRVDSVILSLGYRGVYGDSMSVQNFTVHEIAQSAEFKDSLYEVTGPDLPVAGALSAPVTVNFNSLNEPKLVRPGKDTAVAVNNVLRIPLNVSLGHRLVNYDTSNAYKNDSSFRTYFKGVGIKTDTINSAIKKALAYFDLTAATTRLYIYYRTTSGDKLDTAVTEFSFTNRSSTRTANIVRRNINGSNYATNLNNDAKAQDVLYIQSSPGSTATVYVPGLKTLSNRVIHRAELLVPRLAGQEDHLYAPPSLFLDLIDSSKNIIKTFPNDFSGDPTNGTYNVNDFGGNIKNNEYRFDISRYVQGIVTRKDSSYTMRLYAPFYTLPYYTIPNTKPPVSSPLSVPFFVNPLVAGGRVIVAGGSHPTNKMRIRIIYSKI